MKETVCVCVCVCASMSVKLLSECALLLQRATLKSWEEPGDEANYKTSLALNKSSHFALCLVEHRWQLGHKKSLSCGEN